MHWLKEKFNNTLLLLSSKCWKVYRAGYLGHLNKNNQKGFRSRGAKKARLLEICFYVDCSTTQIYVDSLDSILETQFSHFKVWMTLMLRHHNQVSGLSGLRSPVLRPFSGKIPTGDLAFKHGHGLLLKIRHDCIWNSDQGLTYPHFPPPHPYKRASAFSVTLVICGTAYAFQHLILNRSLVDSPVLTLLTVLSVVAIILQRTV